ncbi:MAG TPA: endonuclease MutS2, partial [Geobacterales bacterium]|nr:endonuclease MutS2 [Geobacterales bacterium]
MIAAETLIALEFPRILEAAAQYGHSEVSRRAIAAIGPFRERQEVEDRFALVEEIRRLLQQGLRLSFVAYYDITPLLELVRPMGAVLEPEQLLFLLPPLRIMSSLQRQTAYRQDIPRIAAMIADMPGFPDILEQLEQSIADDATILDRASTLLFELRGRKRALTERIRRRLEEVVRERQVALFLQDDFITQRSGRWVIPVRMDSKGMVPGVVHDVSNSGETAFVEPLEIIGLANELENLVAEEKGEEIRILKQLSSWIREDADDLGRQFATLVRLDLLQAIARFSEELAAHVPLLSDDQTLRLSRGEHPLLKLMVKQGTLAKVVPLDLTLGGSEANTVSGEKHAVPGEKAQQILVITGPNAGGKTIALKTVGLLTLMALSGMPVPADSASTFPLVDELLIDIGDEQSIAASLSTFSAHMVAASRIVQRAGKRTLILMDELGTGTEPVQGGAIACALLEELQRSGALVVATTHLTDIIGFVHRQPSMCNAAMEFDRQTLTPLFRLTIGEPGQSHALEIARRYGLPERIVTQAQGMIGTLERDFHELLAELRERGRRYADGLQELAQREKELVRRESEADDKLAAAEEKVKNAWEKALQESKEMVRSTRQEVAAILDEARRERSREAKRKVEELGEGIDMKLNTLRPPTPLDMTAIIPGDLLFVSSIGRDATVVVVNQRQGRVRVQSGGKELEVPLADLSPSQGKGATRLQQSRPSVSAAPATLELNIIGKRADDAMMELEPFLNRASLEGIGQIRIVHGKGTGALRRAVAEHLTGHPLVATFRPGEAFEGGE